MQQAQKKLLQMNILVKLLCVVCGTTVFADKHALKEKTAESLCQFSGAAKAAAKTIATKMASAQSRLEEYRKLQMSLTLLAATKPCYAQACQLLATYAAYKAEQVNIVTRTLASRGALAAGASACSACRIDELFFTLHDPVGVSSLTSKTCIDPTSGGSYFANTKNCDFFTSTLNNRVSEAISAGTLTAGGGVITITKGAEQADGGLATDKNKVAHVAEAIRQTDKIKTAMAQGLPPPLWTATEITEFLNGQAETELAEIDKIISGAAEAKDQTKMKAIIDTVFGKKADDGTRPFTKLLTTEAYSYKQDGVNKKVKLLELTETETTKQAVAKIMILNKQAADKTECQAAVITKSKPEEVCNAIEDTTTCNNEKQCSYDDFKETGKKCTYNASKATENGVPATQTQTVGGAGTNEKCKGKLEDACKKAPDCKWDGKECKDSSFLINRKFSLTAVTFMSLIGI